MTHSTKGDKSISLPVASEAEYKIIINNNNTFREYILQVLEKYPEIFPIEMKRGFSFHDWVTSSKQQLPMRRIKLKENGEVYQLRPEFIMPYMIGKTDEMEKALYLCQFGVPFEAIAYVFGRNAMYWYRACCALSRASLVGTTVKNAEKLPQHLLADEKHTWLRGERVFVPTTVASDCILGVSLTDSASPTALTEGYREFKEEFQLIYPDYQPITVNTDGWEATRDAWQTLFPNIILILCFLHDVLKVEKGYPTQHNYRKILLGKLWKAFQGKTSVKFLAGLRKTLIWAKKRIKKKKTLNRLRKLCRRGWSYHDNWLQNLLIASSLNGRRPAEKLATHKIR